ncbi:MAG TPA: phosphopentomutase [Bacillota bacterium]|nr:phosphopentomutase [Bacillota bacterium]
MTKPIPEPDLATTGRRVVVVVLDGAGVGALPDAAAYGDAGANTLYHVLQKEGPLKLPNLNRLGLGRILQLSSPGALPPGLTDAAPPGYYGRMALRSPGKDTTSGHWELAGVILTQPFPVYPRGFPDEVIKPFEQALGRKVLGNKPASGTEIIEELGEKHLQTGYPIVYTSADSVFQIAAHEAVVPPEELYRWCTIAREILTGKHAVGRVIARPFTGRPGAFVRTGGRHDYSLDPPGKTLLDLAAGAGYPVAVIGKVSDIFNHRGITLKRPGGGNDAVAADLCYLLENVRSGVLWATFGDFDTLYGHRNDSAGYAAALEKFDLQLSQFMQALTPGDLLLITADHGCDPTHPGSDHTREYVPLMAWSPSFSGSVNCGTRKTLADLGAGAAAWLKLPAPLHGQSFLNPGQGPGSRAGAPSEGDTI